MAGLQDYIQIASVWTLSNLRWSNTVPLDDVDDPIIDVAFNNSGEAIADIYDISYISVDVLTHTAVARVMTQSPNNPYRNLSGAAVAIDGTTLHKDLIGGLTIRFSASGSFSATWATRIYVGQWLATKAAYGVGAGVPGTPVQHKVVNTDMGAAADCFAQFANMAILYEKTADVFLMIEPFAVGSTEKITGGSTAPYAVTVSAVVGSTASIRVDGLAVNVKNLENSVTGLSNLLNFTDRYQITSGGLNGLIFKLDPAINTSAVSNVLIFPPRHAQIAPDVDGQPGTWGVTPVQLTHTGEAAGVIPSGENAFYWLREIVAENASSLSNPYPIMVELVGLETGAALWNA